MHPATARRTATALVVALVLGGTLGGCSRERVCPRGEEQVRSSPHPEDGTACTDDGVVPEGFETYPPGEEPTTVYVG